MSRYDVEQLLTDVETKLKASLNTKLSELDAEKNDGITLAQIDTEAYLTSLNGKEANFPVCIHYGEVDTSPEAAAGPSVAKRVVVEVAVLLSDDGSDPNILKRAYRYRRALEELFEANWGKIGPGIRLQVTSLQPVSIRSLETAAVSKVIGVQLEAVIV